jgi:hypothetical protein
MPTMNKPNKPFQPYSFTTVRNNPMDMLMNEEANIIQFERQKEETDFEARKQAILDILQSQEDSGLRPIGYSKIVNKIETLQDLQLAEVYWCP